MPKEFVTPVNYCPHCGHQFDRASDLKEGRGPKAGDFSVCIACAKISVFNADQTVRKPTMEEKWRANKDPWITQVQIGISHIVGGKLDKKRKNRRAGPSAGSS